MRQEKATPTCNAIVPVLGERERERERGEEAKFQVFLPWTVYIIFTF
jgi:hypothetical protein